jgi:hypothetical protein
MCNGRGYQEHELHLAFAVRTLVSRTLVTMAWCMLIWRIWKIATNILNKQPCTTDKW